MTARIYTFPPSASFLVDDEPIAFPSKAAADEEEQRSRFVRTLLLDAERELASGDLERGIKTTTAALNSMCWLWRQRGGAA